VIPDAVPTSRSLMMRNACCRPTICILSFSFAQYPFLAAVSSADIDDCLADSNASACAYGESLLQVSRGLAISRQTAASDKACEPGPNVIIPPDPNSFVRGSSMHDVVGPDGVLMISRAGDIKRFAFSEEHLGTAGVRPSKLLATDGSCASETALEKGCVGQTGPYGAWCKHTKRTGNGCAYKAEQAIADSHRRALLVAQERQQHNWTLITEDDAVLVRPQRWDKAFEKAWKKIPSATRIVRLSWCMPGTASDIIQPTLTDTGEFNLIRWHGYQTGYRAGGCTTSYMVHREVIPEMLGLFPCCCPVDCCFENDMYNRVTGSSRSETRGMELMISIDGWGSEGYIKEHERQGWGTQYGVMTQARDELASTRTGHGKKA